MKRARSIPYPYGWGKEDRPTMDGKQRCQKGFLRTNVSSHRIGRKGLTEAFAFLDVRKGLKAKARGRGPHSCPMTSPGHPQPLDEPIFDSFV